MKQETFKVISIISYFFIILMGSMIGIPFFFWILFTIFDFGNPDQFFALLAIIGLLLNFLTRNKQKTLKILSLDILSFLLLISPLIRRMTAISIEKFNYLLFIIPTLIFVVFYIISIVLSVKKYLKNNKI